MDRLKLFQAINYIDDDLIDEARVNRSATKVRMYTICSAAAALFLVIGISLFYNINHFKISDSAPIKAPEDSADSKISSSVNSVNSESFDTSVIISDGTDTQDTQNSRTDGSSTKSSSESSSSKTKNSSSDIIGSRDTEHTVEVSPNTSRSESSLTSSVSSNSPPSRAESTMSSKSSTSSTNEPQVVSSAVSSNISSHDLFYKPFSMTFDPDADEYGIDELPYVDVIISGISYSQLDPVEYNDYRISGEIKDDDFGEFLGIVTEIFPYNVDEYPVMSQEPNLAGAEVFYYAPSHSKAIVIAKKDNQCSIFAVSHQLTYAPNCYLSFEECFRFFGYNDIGEIESISYHVDNLDSGETIDRTIKDFDTIKEITSLLFKLNPQTSDDLSGDSVTPQWYIDGWENYRSNPEAYVRKDFVIDIRFANGTVLKEITYQPFIGNGYVSGMRELTNEQNSKLCSLLE